MLALLLAVLPQPRAAAKESEEEDKNDLREQLTEREDKNRVEHPWTRSLFGNPLTATGEYEITLDGTDPIDSGPTEEDRLRLDQQLEGELFYTFGEPLSFFSKLFLESFSFTDVTYDFRRPNNPSVVVLNG